MEQNLLEKKDQQDQWISNLFKGIGAVEKMKKLKQMAQRKAKM